MFHRRADPATARHATPRRAPPTHAPAAPQLLITPEEDAPALLLNFASVITGLGVSIVEGVVRSGGPLAAPGGGGGGDGGAAAIAAAPEPPAGRRAMRFLLQEGGAKLDAASASGLLFAIQLAAGRGAPTALPTVTAAGGCGCDG